MQNAWPEAPKSGTEAETEISIFSGPKFELVYKYVILGKSFVHKLQDTMNGKCQFAVCQIWFANREMYRSYIGGYCLF